jgi:rod shape-determining protein MreC
MTSRRYLIIGLVLVLALFILGGRYIFVSKLQLSNGLGLFFERLFPYADLKIKLTELQKENADLKAQLLVEKINPEDSIKVYSSYPFNNRSEIAIAAGSDRGVSESNIITYGENILVGRVKAVASEVSIVTTIFDPNFETAVRIGEGAVDALLRGGNELTLSLIAPEAVLEEGAVVYTASPDFPYGLTLGKLKNIERGEDGTYKKVCVEPAFEIKALKDVVVRP